MTHINSFGGFTQGGERGGREPEKLSVQHRKSEISRIFAPVLRDGETTIKIKFAPLRGWALGAERKIVPKCCFRGKRHDNEFLKVRILLSRFASQAAWYRMETGRNQKWEKIGQKIENGPRPEMGKKMARKWRKNGFGVIFPFFPHFGPRAIFYFFWPIFSPFLDFGPFSILYQAA